MGQSEQFFKYAQAYTHYLEGRANHGGEHSELLQVAKAVGPGLTIDEFAQLAEKHAAIVNARDMMSSATYQEYLWGLPERFNKQRKSPVHYRPSRDSSGAPTNSIMGDSSAIDSLAGESAQPQASVAPETLAGLLGGGDSSGGDQPSSSAGTLDKMQMVADAVGVVDQTGLTDLANGGVSLVRAFTEPERAGEHLTNAAISAISAIPIVGDAAKGLKYGRKGAKLAAEGADGVKALDAAGGASKAAGGIPGLGSVDEAAQAALQLVSGGGGGGSGSGGGGGGGGSAGSTDDSADPERIGEASQQAARDIDSLGTSIETFLNGTGAAGAVLVSIGHQVYEKALKPLIDWFKAVDETSKKMLEDSRSLANYSGELGAALQKLDTERFLRDVEKANEQSGSLSKLAGAQSRNEQAKRDLTGPYEMLSIEVQAFRTEISTYILKAIDSIDFIGEFLEWWFDYSKNDKNVFRTDVERGAAMLDEFLTRRKL